MFIDTSPIDVHLAKKLKAVRMQSKVTQYELGELIGVTFQQIQKYENGINKISASRLYEVCRVLNKPVSIFFDGMSIDEDYYNFGFELEKDVMKKEKQRNKEIVNLVGNFNKISNFQIRRSILDLVNNLAKRNRSS